MANPDDLRTLLGEEQSTSASPTSLSDLLSAPSKGSEAFRLLVSGQANMVAGQPTNTATLNSNVLQDDPRLSLQQESQRYYQRQRDIIDNAVRGALDTDPTQLAVAVNTAITANNKVSAIESDVFAPEIAYVRQAAPTSQEDLLQREAALQVAANTRVAELLDEQGTWDTITDIGGFFLPFGTAKDISDISDELATDARLAKIAGGDIESVITKWQSLPVTEREELLDPLFSAIQRATSTGLFGIETDGNALKAAELLQGFFSTDAASTVSTAQNIDIALGAVDVVPAGKLAKLAKLTKAEKVNMMGVLNRAADDLHRSSNAAKVAENLGDVESSAKFSTAAMQDEEIARSLGMTQHTAAQNAFPHQTQEWMKEVTEGASPEIAKQLNQVARDALGYARGIQDEGALMQIGALTKSERRNTIRSFYREMQEVSEDYLNEGVFLENLRITKKDKDGFTYQYTLRNEADPVSVREDGKQVFKVVEKEVKFGVNDITQTYSATVNDPVAQTASKVLSPAAWSTGNFNDAVKKAMAASDLTAANAQKVGDMMLWALDPVKGVSNTKARGRIEAVLEAGDEFINPGSAVRGKTYTVEELAAGVETPSGTVRLQAPNEVEAYYRTRFMADTFYQAQNQIVRRELELGGFKTISVKGDTEMTIGKAFDQVSSAKASIKDKFGYRAYDEEQGKVVDLSDSLLDSQYADGKQLVRLRNDWNSNGGGELARDGEFVEYVLTRSDKVRELPEQVLQYKNGYVPKINKAEFFVAQKLPIVKGGVQGANKTQALRAFNSKQDAEAFRQVQIDKFLERHPEVPREQADALFELGDANELNAANRLEEAVSSGNGLFTGNRSNDDILFGLTGQRLERVSPLEAFQRNVQHLGKNLTRNELRIGEEKRWLNTVRQEFPEIKIEGFGNTKLPDTPRGKALDEVRRVIGEWNAIPEKEETLFAGAIQRLHDWTLHGARSIGFRDKDSIHSLMSLKHFSPFQAMKAANMHVMLGALNPAQIYVQASAAAVAAARHGDVFLGKTALSDFHAAFKFSMLDNMQNPTALGKALKAMLRDGQLTADEAAAYKAFRKTGYYESVFNNADTAYMQGTGFGASMKVMGKASNVSLMFYRGGEMFNRRYSFIKAFARHLQAGGKRDLTDDQLQKVIENANESMLELNQANRAWWQGGAGTSNMRQVLGMSTQFLQVMGKTMELAVKGTGRGGWTNREKARILTGQVLLFGAAGVPIFNAAPGAIMNWLGLEPNEQHANLVNQGMVGAIVGNILDADVDVANRAALGGQILSTWRDLFTSDESLLVKGLGVSGETGSRFFQALSELKPLAMGIRDEELTSDQLIAAASIIGQVPTTGRNLHKAYLMHNTGRIYDRRKRPIAENTFSFNTELATALGFRPTEETRTRMLQLDNRDFEDLAQEMAQVRINLWFDWIKVQNMDADYGKVVEAAIQMQQEAADNPMLEARINEIVERRVWDEGQTLQERELNKFIQRTAVEHITEGYIIDRGLMDGASELSVLQPFQDKLGTDYQE